MKLALKQNVTIGKASGKGWELEVTGQPDFVKEMLDKYGPEIEKIAARIKPSNGPK